MVGVGRGAQLGVLIKNAEALERLEKVDTLVVDKTGTLTEGKPSVVAVKTAAGFDEGALIRLAASLERSSEHSLGEAIIAAAGRRKLQLSEATNFEGPAGKGVTGIVEGKKLWVGSANFLRAQASKPSRWTKPPTTCGKTVLRRFLSASMVRWLASSRLPIPFVRPRPRPWRP